MTLPGCRWSGMSLKNERKTVVSTNAAQTVSAIRPSSIPNQRMPTDSAQIRFVTYFFTRLPCTRWTLRLLESKVVELGIVDRASDSTIGRTLKKRSQAPSATMLGDSAEGEQRICSGDGRCAGRLHATARSRLPAGLPGREFKAVACRNARADPDESGPGGPLRL